MPEEERIELILDAACVRFPRHGVQLIVSGLDRVPPATEEPAWPPPS